MHEINEKWFKQFVKKSSENQESKSENFYKKWFKSWKTQEIKNWKIGD